MGRRRVTSYRGSYDRADEHTSAAVSLLRRAANFRTACRLSAPELSALCEVRRSYGAQAKSSGSLFTA